MLPRHFVLRPALPRNERGKVDRTALPSVEVRSTPPTLAGPAELWLSSIWESILGIDSIDREDDFFELGGDSLASTEVVAKIHDRSEEHTSELQSLMRSSYAVFCLKKKNKKYT